MQYIRAVWNLYKHRNFFETFYLAKFMDEAVPAHIGIPNGKEVFKSTLREIEEFLCIHFGNTEYLQMTSKCAS